MHLDGTPASIARLEFAAGVEALRHHYASTLGHWVSRLERHHTQALQYVSESTDRVWRLYMGASALEFEPGEIGVYQVSRANVTRGVRVYLDAATHIREPPHRRVRHLSRFKEHIPMSGVAP